MPPFSMVLTPEQEIADDVEPRRPFVVGLHDDPGSKHTISLREHFIAGFRVSLPEFLCLGVDRPELPLPKRVNKRRLVIIKRTSQSSMPVLMFHQ